MTLSVPKGFDPDSVIESPGNLLLTYRQESHIGLGMQLDENFLMSSRAMVAPRLRRLR
jgi:hypothetical protein